MSATVRRGNTRRPSGRARGRAGRCARARAAGSPRRGSERGRRPRARGRRRRSGSTTCRRRWRRAGRRSRPARRAERPRGPRRSGRSGRGGSRRREGHPPTVRRCDVARDDGFQERELGPFHLDERDLLDRDARRGIHGHGAREERDVREPEDALRIASGSVDPAPSPPRRTRRRCRGRSPRTCSTRARCRSPREVGDERLHLRARCREAVGRVDEPVDRAAARVDEQGRVVAVGREHRGRRRPAERSCFRNAPESGTNIGVKITSGCGSALWIFVTTAPNSVWPILYMSSPTIVPPQMFENASSKNGAMSFVYGISGEPMM